MNALQEASQLVLPIFVVQTHCEPRNHYRSCREIRVENRKTFGNLRNWDWNLSFAKREKKDIQRLWPSWNSRRFNQLVSSFHSCSSRRTRKWVDLIVEERRWPGKVNIIYWRKIEQTHIANSNGLSLRMLRDSHHVAEDLLVLEVSARLCRVKPTVWRRSLRTWRISSYMLFDIRFTPPRLAMRLGEWSARFKNFISWHFSQKFFWPRSFNET